MTRSRTLLTTFLSVLLTPPLVSFSAELPPTAKAIVAGFEAGSVQKAVEAANDAMLKAPRDPVTLLWVGRAYGQKAMEASIFTKMSWAKKCRTAWETAVEVDPAMFEARRELIRYYVMAPGIAGGGKEKAEAQVARIVATDPSKGELARGLYLELTKKPVEAEAAYRRAVSIDPRSSEPALALGGLLAGQKRWEEARALFEGRLAADPSDTGAVYQLGRLSVLSGLELEKGIGYLDRFLASPPSPDGPTWADARWRKGLLLERLGKTTEAIGEYRAALKLNPGHRFARKELERLKAT